MKIKHTVTFPYAAESRAKLLGFPSGNLEIYEHDPLWEQVQDLMQQFDDTIDVAETTFSAAELTSAEWLFWEARWLNGYPFPDDGYMERTYNLSAACSACGVEAMQKEPFRLKKEPRWGRRSVFQLNWEEDKWFIRSDVFRAVFEPRGVLSWPVLDRRGRVIESVIQLNLDAVPTISAPVTWPIERCAKCQRTKYNYEGAGPFPAFATQAGADHPCLTSSEWFGSGGAAFRATFISQSLYRSLSDAGLSARGVRFRPVEKTTAP